MSGAQHAVVIPTIPPFDLALTVAALRRRPTNAVDLLVAGEYRRALPLGGRLRVLAARQTGTETVAVRMLDDPLEGQLDDADLAEAARQVSWMLGLQRDLAPAWARVRAQARLAPLADGLAGLKPPRFPDLWTALFGVVPFQQVSLESGVATVNRLVMAFGARVMVGGQPYYAFPTAEAIAGAPAAALRACGLSAAKVHTLAAVAEALRAGALDEAELATLDDAAAIARLTALPGIGAWSAQVVLLRGLGRLSVFPLGDSGMARNQRQVFGLAGSEIEVAQAELLDALGEFRGFLYFLLLGHSLRVRGLLGDSAEMRVSDATIGGFS